MAPCPRAERRGNSAAQTTLETAPAVDRKACVVCGAATAWPESSFCFMHYQPEEEEVREAQEQEGQLAQGTQETAGAQGQPEGQLARAALAAPVMPLEAPGPTQEAAGAQGQPEGQLARVAQEQPQEALGLPREPTEPQGQSEGQPAQAAQEQPQEPAQGLPGEPAEPQGQPEGQPAQAAQERPQEQAQGQPALFAKQYYSKLHRELSTGATSRGMPLTDEAAQSHIAKLRQRAVVMGSRYRAAELARISEVERRFLGHLGAAAESVNAHTTAALAPLLARAEGRVPARREGQSATERKQEVDMALVASRLLREERKRLVEEERTEKRLLAEAKKAERAAKKARAT